MSKYDKYIGHSFYNLTCEAFIEADKRGTPARAKYLWRCDCGNTRVAKFMHVKHAATTECKDCVRKRKSTSLGMSESKIYFIWRSMKWRCGNHENYSQIDYDPTWETFEGFYADMAESYFDGASIDRIDNSKGYCKTNCQWLTLSEHGKKTAQDCKNG